MATSYTSNVVFYTVHTLLAVTLGLSVLHSSSTPKLQTLVIFKTIGGNEKIDSIDPVGKMKGLILSTFERGTTMRRKVNSSLALNKKETPQGIVLLNQK